MFLSFIALEDQMSLYDFDWFTESEENAVLSVPSGLLKGKI